MSSWSGLKLFVCGPHSTGKSTLVEELKKYLNMDTCPEVARNVIKRLKLNATDFNPSSNPITFAYLQVEILKNAFETMQMHRNSNTVFDRGIDPLVYLRYYNGKSVYCITKQSVYGMEIIEKSRNGMVFVVFPHPACNDTVQDDIRLKPLLKEQIEFVDTLIDILDENRIDFTPIIRLNLHKRVKTVLEKVVERNASLLNDKGRIFVGK